MHPMAERELYGNRDAKQFPFVTVRSHYGSQLAAKLSSIEREDKFEPHTQFVTALNCLLVWTQVRTATLPTWDLPIQREAKELVDFFSKWSRQLSWTVQIDEVIIVPRRQRYRSGGVTDQ